MKLLIVVITILLSGCHLVEVNVNQKAITDVGDSTQDGYADTTNKEEKSSIDVK